MVKVSVTIDGLSVDVQVPESSVEAIQKTATNIDQQVKELKAQYGLNTDQALILIAVKTHLEKEELEKNLEEYVNFVKSIIGDIKKVVNE